MKIKLIVIIALWTIITGFILSNKAKAEDKFYERYIINVRIAKTGGQLPTFIKNNLTAIQTSLGKLKDVSVKINANNPGRSVEDTDKFTIDNNAIYLELDASFAVPHPVPQAYLDEQATFETFLVRLSENAMADTDDFKKVISKHPCRNGILPFVACTGVINF